MTVFLFALTVYFFLASFKRTSLLYLLILGTAVGLLFNVRPNAVVLFPIMPLLIILALRKKDKQVREMATAFVLYTVGLCLSLSPFLVRNYRIANQWAVGPTQSGFNLYLGNNLANPDPYYRPVPFASSSPRVQGIHFTVEASRRIGKKLSPQEASTYWYREVLRIAGENPGAFFRKLWLKTLVFFNQFEAGDHYHIGYTANFVPFFKLPFPSLWLMLPLGLAGMSVTLLESRKSLALGLILFAYGATLVVFFCNTRYRLLLVVGLIPFAVIGVERFWFFIKIRNWQKIALYAAIGASFFVIEFLPVRATDDLSAYYNTHAIVLRSRKSVEEAMQYWEKSSRMDKPFSALSNLSLAGRYLRRKEINKAMGYLNKISEDSFAAAPKYELIGDIWMRRAQVEKAISAYTRCLEINSAQLRVRKKLISIYRKINPEKARVALKELKYIEFFYNSPY